MSYLQVAEILWFILFLSDALKKSKKNNKGKPGKSPYLFFLFYSK